MQDKYRIVKQTGNITNDVVFLIQKKKRKLFSGHKWKFVYQFHPEGFRKILEFNTLKKAEFWIVDMTETVSFEIIKNNK